MTLPPDARSVPALRSHWLFGSLAEVKADYLGALLRAHRELGPVVRVDVGPPGWRETIYSVASPELAAELLGLTERYSKDEPGYRELKRLGNGVLTSEGEVWRRQRRMLAPLVTMRRISTSYVPTMVEEAERVARRWQEAADAGGTVDASAAMLELASRTIGRILFGPAMEPAVPQIMQFGYVNDEMLRRTVSPHTLPLWVPTPTNRRFRHGLREIRSVVDGVIADRRAQGEAGATDDMLGLMLAARDANGDRFTDSEVTDQVLVFLLAGHDTTATTLACTLAELAKRPEWQQRIRDELDRELGGRRATAEDLPRLVLTNRFVREAMRLYPASHSLGRTPVQDEVLGGYHLPAGSSVIVYAYALHRSGDHWERPDEFDPDRNVDDPEAARRQKQAWMVFGSGPHICIGANLATVETTVVLATILQEVRLTTDLPSVPVHAAITLKPTGELPLAVHRLADAPVS